MTQPKVLLDRPCASRVAIVSALLLTTLVPADASACGGCFSPPNPMGTVSVVGAHRMVLLSAPTGSILWDQIQYTGSPADFVWVLPVQGMPTVEIADNGFFESLVVATDIHLTAPTPPRTTCPPAYCGGSGCGCLFANASPSAGGYYDGGAISLSDAGPVHVYHEGVVGPYETATIGSTDPMALVTWLQDHGYDVPSAMLPTIDHYVSLSMNFVALRLAPMTGVDRMTPVRVRIPGLALTLPLRMIAAGVGAEVSLELFVFSEARMETATFPNAEVDRAAVTFDWTPRTFDYDARFEDALFAGTGTQTNWVTEFAAAPNMYAISSYTSGSGTGQHFAATDTALVTASLAAPYLTRLRTRLPPSELGEDLVLRLSSGADVPNNIYVTHELHRAADIDCPNRCGGGGCATSSTRPPLGLTAIFAALLVGRVAFRRRKSR
jgi:hypothetical protein